MTITNSNATLNNKEAGALPVKGYVTNKTLPFINTRIYAKIQKKIDTIFKKRGTYVKRKSN